MQARYLQNKVAGPTESRKVEEQEVGLILLLILLSGWLSDVSLQEPDSGMADRCSPELKTHSHLQLELM